MAVPSRPVVGHIAEAKKSSVVIARMIGRSLELAAHVRSGREVHFSKGASIRPARQLFGGVVGVVFLCHILPSIMAVREEGSFFRVQGFSGATFAIYFSLIGVWIASMATAVMVAARFVAGRFERLQRAFPWIELGIVAVVLVPSAGVVGQSVGFLPLPDRLIAVPIAMIFSYLVLHRNLVLFSFLILVWTLVMAVTAPGAEASAEAQPSRADSKRHYFADADAAVPEHNVLVIAFDEVSWHALSLDGETVRPEFPNIAKFQTEGITFSEAISPYPYSQVSISALTSVAQLDAEESSSGLGENLERIVSGPNVFNAPTTPFALSENTPFVDCVSPACEIKEYSNPPWLQLVDAVAVVGRAAGGPFLSHWFPPISGSYENFWSIDRKLVASKGSVETRFMRNDPLVLPATNEPWLALFHSNASHHPWIYDSGGSSVARLDFGEFDGSYIPFWCTKGKVFCTPQLAERARESYMNSVLRVDEELGEIIGQLSSMKLLDTTVIVLTSDHGISFPVASSGRAASGLPSQYLSALAKVPLLVRYPDLSESGTVVGLPTSPGSVVRRVVDSAMTGRPVEQWSEPDSPVATVLFGDGESPSGSISVWRESGWVAWEDFLSGDEAGFLEVSLSDAERRAFRDVTLELTEVQVGDGDSSLAISRVRTSGPGCGEATVGWARLASGEEIRMDFDLVDQSGSARLGWVVLPRGGQIMQVGC